MQHGTSVTVLAAPATITASGNGAAVNVGDYHGLCLLHMNGIGTAGTTTVSLQHSDDGSTNWVDVPNTTFAQIGTTAKADAILFNADRFKKFVRVKDVSASSGSAIRSVVLVGNKRESQ
ncbi:hypothetical protein [Salmonella phage PT1]|nr:hypothetical protein [Salmonella phage PT1]